MHESSNYPDVAKGNLILASHSGTSSISFFKNLYKLEVNDDVYVNYNNVAVSVVFICLGFLVPLFGGCFPILNSSSVNIFVQIS